MALIISPPPNDIDVNGISWKQWFYKIRNDLLQALDLTNVSGILNTAHGGTGASLSPNPNELLVGNVSNSFDLKTLVAGSNVTITNGVSTITIAALGGGGGSGKIYEPVAVNGAIVFSINGDVLMAWGGEYAT